MIAVGALAAVAVIAYKIYPWAQEGKEDEQEIEEDYWESID